MEHRPSAFSIQLLDAETLSRGSATEGMLKVKSPPVDQMLWWSRPKQPLRKQAEHERKLLVAAANEAESSVSFIDEEFQESRLQGHMALSWSAVVNKTHFRSTLVSCGRYHVLLTTMGPQQELVASLHVRSLETLSCGPAAPQSVQGGLGIRRH